LTSVHFWSISSWRWGACIQLLFESQVSVLQLKKLFSSFIFSEVTARERECYPFRFVTAAWLEDVGLSKDFAVSDILVTLEGYFLPSLFA